MSLIAVVLTLIVGGVLGHSGEIRLPVVKKHRQEFPPSREACPEFRRPADHG